MKTLHPPTFRPLPLGSIHPGGWLARQLRIQADGLSGHLDEFWPDIKDSQWFGGDSEAWERAPYWLDGLIPLAYALDDAVLKQKVARYMDHILTHQHADGWLGPRVMIAAANQQARPNYDLWAQLLATKVLVQYDDASGDDRAVIALQKALHQIDRHIDRAPLFNWGQFRWFEALIAIFWLYERTHDPELLDLAVKLRAQGFDWPAFFNTPNTRWPAAMPTPKGRWNYMSHVVNNAMAVKAPALWWRITGDPADRAAVTDMLAKLDRYHGMVTGMFTGDECLAGKRPTQGTELCAVVEFTYSLVTLLSILGDPSFGDRLEQVIFNALPATFSPDMWAHQYDQQVNQVECSIREGRTWNTNGPQANIFGLEPNYGCCTANFSQGWPKFATHLWMRATEDDGLAAVAYAPSTARITVDGVPVTAELDTDYPFRNHLTLTVRAVHPVRFPLWLRIPGWTAGATIQVAGEAPVSPTPGTFHRIERQWEGSTDLSLTFPMRPRLWRGHNEARALVRGPLVYALPIEEDWRRVHADEPDRELPHGDWEVYPTTPWAYAVALHPTTLDTDVTFTEHPIDDPPFSHEHPPVTATVKGKALPGWELEDGSAADAPPSPVTSPEPLETLTLVPYPCTALRLTEFPVLKDI